MSDCADYAQMCEILLEGYAKAIELLRAAQQAAEEMRMRGQEAEKTDVPEKET